MPLVTSPSDIRGFSQANQPSTNPEGGLWYDTSLDTLFVSDGSTFNTVGASSFAGAAVVSQSTTIGNYTTPTSATASSTVSGLSTITLDTSVTNNSISISPTVSITVGSNTQKLLVCHVSYDNQATNSVTSITFGSQSFTQLVTLNGSSNVRTDLWYLINPTSGIGNVTVNFAFLPALSQTLNVTSWYNVNQTTPINTSNYSTYAGVGVNPLGLSVTPTNTGSILQMCSTTVNGITSQTRTLLYTRTSNNVYSASQYFLTPTINSSNSLSFGMGGTLSGNSAVAFEILAGSQFSASLLLDNNTATRWTSTSQINPNAYVDQGSTLNFAAVAFFYDNVNTTATSMLIQTSADAITWTTKRTITTSNLVSGYNYYRFNIATGVRYVRFYGNDAGAKVLSLYEVKIYQRTSDQILNDLGILEISPTDATLNATGT